MSKIKLLSIFSLMFVAMTIGFGAMKSQSYSPMNTIIRQSQGAANKPVLSSEITNPALTVEAPEETPPSGPTHTPKVGSEPKAANAAPRLASTAVQSPAETCGGAFAQQFLCLLNQYRVSKKLAPLSGSSDLSKVALAHSQWMQANGIFSHTGIDGSRLTERCDAAGIICRAENLAKSAKSAQHLLDMWKASPGHNANLLGKYSTIGLGTSDSYVTLLLN